MKSSFSKMFTAALLGLALSLCASADLAYSFGHGHGTQPQTYMTEYDESCDFDYARGYSAPIVGWYSTTFSYGYLLTVYVDTDYASNYYFGCAWQTNGARIDVSIS